MLKIQYYVILSPFKITIRRRVKLHEIVKSTWQTESSSCFFKLGKQTLSFSIKYIIPFSDYILHLSLILNFVSLNSRKDEIFSKGIE